MKNCPDCGASMIGVEYAYGHPERYDGVSEWACPKCGTRIGRWSGIRLGDGGCERRFGKGDPLTKDELDAMFEAIDSARIAREDDVL